MHSDIQRLIALPSLDSEYRFGKPKTYLTAHELARLTIMRSKLGETRQEREAEAWPSRAAVDAQTHRRELKPRAHGLRLQ